MVGMNNKNNFFYNFVILCVMLNFCIDSVITNIAYQKATHFQEKSDNNIKNDISLESTFILKRNQDILKATTPRHVGSTLACNDAASTEMDFIEDTTATRIVNTTTSSSHDIHCTCGVFLSSQFDKGSSEPPKGDPVISTVLGRTFICNSTGRRQCQTKCLEQIVQHLPKSSNILCASLDHDIRKERAFLFVRNCNSMWYNTNLAAGREYCCKNGLPYNCPKK